VAKLLVRAIDLSRFACLNGANVAESMKNLTNEKQIAAFLAIDRAAKTQLFEFLLSLAEGNLAVVDVGRIMNRRK